MKIMTFSSRVAKEIMRDPISLFFGLVFPIIILLLLLFINKSIPNDLFNISSLTPGIAVFGLSFMSLFSAQIIAKDRESDFLARLFTTPMTANDFIFGYTLPLILMAMVQLIIYYSVAIMLGLEFTIRIPLVIISMLPVTILFIAIGLLCGSIFNEKAVTGICGALLTNITAWFSGAWFSLDLVGGWYEKISNALPFVHAVNIGRAMINRDYAYITPHIWWILGYSLVTGAIAMYIFKKQMVNI